VEAEMLVLVMLMVQLAQQALVAVEVAPAEVVQANELAVQVVVVLL
jgi:hypothetical protein